VTWRDGVHISDTPIWCDARRRRDVCFVSSADRVGRTGHGQLIGSPLTLALLGAGGGGHLAVPLHRRFTLGTVRLELIASGRGPGAAALFVDIAGKTILYAGAIRTSGIEPAGVRACDAVVVAAPYARTFVPLAKAIEQTLDWTARELVAGRRPVLLVDTALDGLEVAMALATAGIPIAGARAIREAAQRAGDLAVDAIAAANARAVRDAELRGDKTSEIEDAPRALQIASPGKDPRAIVWLARDRAGLQRATSNVTTSIAALGGEELDADACFEWTNASGTNDVLAWIESTNAREVYVTGACADEIARVLGARARVIGPPHQMTLFEATP
jgi:hypothetical protein